MIVSSPIKFKLPRLNEMKLIPRKRFIKLISFIIRLIY